MNKTLKNSGVFFLLVVLNICAYVPNIYAATNPVPRFGCIKSREVNARKGPSIRYPIEWVFVKKNEPVEIVAEFEQWRKIRDKYGEGGWVHTSMLSGNRYVVVGGTKAQALYNRDLESSRIIAYISPEVRCQLYKCTDRFCNVAYGKYKGWILKESLWGVYPKEK